MLREIARGRFTVIPGFRSKMTNFIGTRFPGLLRWVVDGKVAKVASKMERGTRVPAE